LNEKSHSIIIPTKQRQSLLQRAVRSALAAASSDGEVLVIDDHSSVPARISLSDLSDPRLRIVELAQGRTGVSAARNAGLEQARGTVVFFLDDDDEMLPEYCRRTLQDAVGAADYGFSSYRQASDGNTADALPGRIRFAHGPIPKHAPLRKHLCGFGMGFWIHRRIALEMGEIAMDISINEDTDFVCRLINAGKRGWYSAAPGVVLHAHDGNGTDIMQITKRTAPEERARCMRVLCDRFPDMVRHLGASYIRHCVKTGEKTTAWRFVASQPDGRTRRYLQTFLLLKIAGQTLFRRARTD
jgi:glycosyltransferase involved in cell wall biosynthesis